MINYFLDNEKIKTIANGSFTKVKKDKVTTIFYKNTRFIIIDYEKKKATFIKNKYKKPLKYNDWILYFIKKEYEVDEVNG